MRFNLTRWLAAAVMSAGVVLTGCGGGGSSQTTVKKADGEIREARTAISNGDVMSGKNEFAMAMAEYKKAREIVAKAKSFAKGSELTELKALEEQARDKFNKAEVNSVTFVKPVVTPPPPRETKVAAVTDPAEIKKKEEERKKKEMEDAKNRVVSALTTTDRPSNKKIEEDPAEVATKGNEKKTPAAGAGSGDDEAVAEEEKPKKKKQEGPFPDMDEKSPELQVIGLFKHGNVLLAYCQAFNRRQEGRRIATVVGYFKDANNQPCVRSGSTAAFPYQGFSLKAKDMIADQPTNAIRGGTHQITGQEAFRFVVVAEGDTIKDVKKVTVQLNWDDGGDIYAEAPLGNPPEGVAAAPAAGEKNAPKKK